MGKPGKTKPPESAAEGRVPCSKPRFLPVLAGAGCFAVCQFAWGVWRLVAMTGGMENRFSRLAREEHLGFVAWENIRLLPAYAILTLLAALLVFPMVGLLSRLRRPWDGSRTRVTVIGSFLLTALLHFHFLLQLVRTRPYFLGDAEFGHWYFIWLDALPDFCKPALHALLFLVIPAVWIAFVLLWYARRCGKRLRLAAVATAVLAGGIVFARSFAIGGPDPAPARPGAPNIIIIGSDSLRGDRLGCAGYRPARSDGPAAQGVSPSIDTLAAKSVRFERCYTAIASTIESGVQLMTSTYPHTHGIRQMYPDRGTVEAAAERTIPLASLLAAQGYDTAAIGDWCAGYYEVTPLGFRDISVSSFDNFRTYVSQAVTLSHFVIPLYFDNAAGYRLFPQLKSFAQFVTPEVVTDRVERGLADAARSGRPFFWHVFYSCNHLPYRSREPFLSMFSDPAYAGPHRHGVDFDIDRFIGGTDLESKWRALPEKEVRQIRALYDGSVRQFDHCVGEVLRALREHGLDDNTIVVITSDHGDDLYEPGVTLGHGLTFNGGLHANHVPMIVHVPGMAPRVIGETVRLIDVAPTLAELAGVAVPGSWEGRSFAPWLRGEGTRMHRPFYGETGFPFIQFRVPGVERPRLPPMDAMTAIDPDYNHQFVLRPEYREPLVEAKQRCLRTRDWKLVCTPTAAGGRHFGLFHLAADPDGLRDLAAERPEVLEPMRRALERWMDHKEETCVSAIFPQGEP
jgi:arylsulfatase A-like enzyme